MMFNTIELFAGCGGLTEGFKSTNKYQMLAAVEWDKNPLIVLRNRLEKKWNYPDVLNRVIHFDIQRVNDLLNGFNDQEYGSSVGLNRLVENNNVDVIIGGPPCQAYSIAGRIRDENGMRDDYRNYLFESYIEIVKHFKPLACIFENVTGMLSAMPDGTPIIDKITASFEHAGYCISKDIKNDAVFDVSEFGIPQKRKRVIIAAFNNEHFEEPEQAIKEFYEELNSRKTGIVTVEQALFDLPKIYPFDIEKNNISHYVDRANSNITDHEPRYNNKRDVDIFRLLASDIENGENKYISTKSLQELYTKVTGKKSNVHKYHVLRKDKPSNTIPAHLYKDGLRHIHPDPKQARSITVREAARLQSFPDDFEFIGSMGAKYKMIGNAVPPLFASIVAESLSKILLRYNKVR